MQIFLKDDIRLDLKNGHALVGPTEGEVTVYHDGRVVARIKALVKSEEGADGGLYPCVKFEVDNRHDI